MLELGCFVVVALCAVGVIGLTIATIVGVGKLAFDVAVVPLALTGAIVKVTLIAAAVVVGGALLVAVGVPLLVFAAIVAVPLLLLAAMGWAVATVFGWLV